MWTAALWDRTTGNYAEGQDWSNDPHNMWEAELVMQATLCVQGWQDVKTRKVQQRVSSVQCPMPSSVQCPTSVADELEDFMSVFTKSPRASWPMGLCWPMRGVVATTWCRRGACKLATTSTGLPWSPRPNWWRD